MAHETHTDIDLGALLLENPNSDTLQYLLSPQYEEENSRPYTDDWGHRLQAETGLDEPTISAAGAIAVYLNQMSSLKAELKQEVLNEIKQLHLGQKVVQLTRDSGLGHSERINFDPRVNGILVKEPRVVTNSSPYSYNLALHFADQARPIETSFYTETAVGEDQISELHASSLGKKEYAWIESGTVISQQRLKNSAIMQKLGLLEGIAEFENERDEVVASVMECTDPNTAHTAALEWGVELLPDLHLLNPKLANRRIKEIARSEHQRIVVSDKFIEAVAQIRAPKALFSLGKFAADAVRARARAEVYDIAAGQEDISPITPEYDRD